MRDIKITFSYSYRLVKREWRRFVLSFFSLIITAVVMSLVLLLTSSSSLLLQEQARELQGGDIVLESNSQIASDDFWSAVALYPEAESKTLSFSATLQSLSATLPFSVEVIDDNYPLYGQLILVEGKYTGITAGEILMDKAGVEKLGINIGDKVTFGNQEYSLAGIVLSEPTSLFGGFRFFPKAFINQAGFALAGIDPLLLRAEYSVAGKFSSLSNTDKANIRTVSESFRPDLQVRIAGENRRGLQFGLQAVTDFLVVAVLITSVLAAVNIYSSTLYLVSVERRSLAVLLALGINKRTLTSILGVALFYIVLLSSLLGVWLGAVVFDKLADYISMTYLITLPNPDVLLYAGVCVGLISAIATASFVPAVRQSLSFSPKQILIGNGENTKTQLPLRTLLLTTFSTLFPLVLLASFLLNSFLDGLIVISTIVVVYVVVSLVFTYLLQKIYLKRDNFSFFLRSIIAQKKADGLFGIISFSSLFVALTALTTLSLLQISLEKYLTNDLVSTVPTTYVLDIQPSQKDLVIGEFPDLNLFANIPARILSIDNLQIQDALANNNDKVDRELGREFNITSDTVLPSSDAITAGTWSGGRSGEISVEEGFAERANIKLGSEIVFLVQGFEIKGKVTSLRSADTRSGLPYFYFILSPADLANFPGVYFGYAYYEADRQKELSRFLATDMPNISVIETQDIGALVIKVVSTLLIMVLIVTFPPLLIATLLIATLVVSSYAARRRDGARLRAVGGTKKLVMKQYLAETISLTFIAAVSSYFVSVVVTYAVSKYFLKLESVVLFNVQLLLGLSIIVGFVGLIGYYLFKTDTMPLRELLAYETNQ